MSEEKWTPIHGFEGLYEVSTFGNVRSITRYKKVLKPQIDKSGYRVFVLKRKYKGYHLRAGRLVATTFIPNPLNKPIVNHIDTDRKNDRVDNLEWCTPMENVLHSYRLGHYVGSHHKKVKQMQNGVCIRVWNSIAEAARALKITDTNICRCCKRKRPSAGGYQWEEYEE